MSPGSKRRRAGFTLVELGVVILIIGIMMSFLLVASWEGLRRADERATQALILKLDTAVADRLESLLSQRPEPNNAHRFLAMTVAGNQFIESEARAQLIAKVDYIKRELPDVFFYQRTDPLYPLNFGGPPFNPSAMPPGASSGKFAGFVQLPAAYAPYVLPIGHAMRIDGQYDTSNRTFGSGITPLGDVTGLDMGLGTPPRFTSPQGGQGIFGASYAAIGSLTKQLGYPPRGYNGVDDDGNGLIDELRVEEMFHPSDPDRGTKFATLLGEVNDKLARHRHTTARSEMLYAILVGGVGPLGSVFSPDDFTDREVQDTDGDGLLEFVDAWGRPLQFYRWPTYFVSDYGAPARGLQKGDAPYAGLTEPREENPLDPNQLLVAPAWWSNLAALPTGPAAATADNMSPRARSFQQQFFSLVDPYADVNNPIGSHWDRSSYYRRRATFFKHLIVSAGPDRQYGVGSFGLNYSSSGQQDRQPIEYPPSAQSRDTTALQLTLIENQGARGEPEGRAAGSAGLFHEPPTSAATVFIRDRWGTDDLTNHAVNSTGSGGR